LRNEIHLGLRWLCNAIERHPQLLRQGLSYSSGSCDQEREQGHPDAASSFCDSSLRNPWDLFQQTQQGVQFRLLLWRREQTMRDHYHGHHLAQFLALPQVA